MASNYDRLFSIESNQFSSQCPVILCAGAIFKHKSKGTLVSQIKFKNISDKSIIALKAKLSFYSPA